MTNTKTATKGYVGERSSLNRPHGITVRAYIDNARCWVTRPLPEHQLARLRKHSQFEVTDDPMLFDPRYRQRLEVAHPDQTALQLLARLPADTLCNYTELALDLLPLNLDADLEGAIERLRHSLLLRNHRGQAKEFSPLWMTTRQLPKGERRPGRWAQAYADKPCRHTGHMTCMHLETRHEGLRETRRVGITHPAHLAAFDFVTHFAQVELYQVDFERLGRLVSNQRSGSRRQKTRFDSDGTNLDELLGRRVYHERSLDADRKHRSLQSFVQEFGRGPYLIPSHTLYDVHSAFPKLLSEVPVVKALDAFLRPSEDVSTGSYNSLRKTFYTNST